MAEQNEDQEDGRSLKELPALFEEECAADTEEIPRADTEHDEQRHAQRAMPKGAPRGDKERPARVDDGGACQEEQPQVELQPEWRRRRRKESSHRGVDKNWYSKGQTDPEAVAHVAHHRRQVLAAMAHIMRHVRRHGGLCFRRYVTFVTFVTCVDTGRRSGECGFLFGNNRC